MGYEDEDDVMISWHYGLRFSFLFFFLLAALFFCSYLFARDTILALRFCWLFL
jgi:hypothetical protein